MRLLLVTRRFWPLVGDAATAMAGLAHEFRRSGAQVTVWTAQWEPNWPRAIDHGGVPVVRIPYSPAGFLGEWRYRMRLARSLGRRRQDFDLALVASLRHDAAAVLEAFAGSQAPVVLMYHQGGPDGDLHWQAITRFGRRVRRHCLNADAVVACGPALGAELRQQGYPPQRIHVIPSGVAIPPPRNARRRLAARRALGRIHADLAMESDSPLVVYVGRLDYDQGLLDLVRAWEVIAASRPQARLWLVGDGPYRQALSETIAHRGLGRQVRLPGVFDSAEELFAAADLFVLPDHRVDTSIALLEAMAAGLPVIAADCPGARPLVAHASQGLLTPPHNPAALASAMQTLLDDTEMAHRIGAAARQRAKAEFSLPRAASEYRELFHRLISEKQKQHGPTGAT